MRIGTIGTGVIVDRMIEAINLTENMFVEAVYSRSKEKAQTFALKHGIQKYYDDLDEMLQDDAIDTIYVASPNSLHYIQSKKAILAGKHVINEKPFTPTLAECEELFALAKEKNVFIFEAITTLHLPNYRIVKEHIEDVGDIKWVQCNFSQYSSKYGKYKAHEQTNAFDPNFNGGAMMDINVYNLHFVTGIFGKPDSILYKANLGYNGIDTSGIAILEYPHFMVSCIGAKDSSSENHVYIQGDKGTIRVFGASTGVCPCVEFILPKRDMIGKKDTTINQSLSIEQEMHMTYECQEFERITASNDIEAYEKLCDQTRLVVSLLETCVKSIQI